MPPRRFQPPDVVQLRLRNQQITRSTFDKPGEVVRWFGAVQAQDVKEALWAVGLRTRGASQTDVEAAIARREIVRTWPMRRTLHFVAPNDIRWMLDLLAPRLVSGSAARHRWLELDERVFARAEKLCERVLAGGAQLTRTALYAAFASAGISTAQSRGLHIVAHLSQRGVLCHGPRSGKEHTFVLLDEWAPNAQRLERQDAIAELALRYFTSHGPATLHDFSWWSGLSLGEARKGAESVKPRLVNETIGDVSYWLAPPPSGARRAASSPAAYLLPAFDEYTVAYRDRSAVLDPAFASNVNAGGGIFKPIVVIDGKVLGTWRRAIHNGGVTLVVSAFSRFNRKQSAATEAAAERYGSFLQLPVMTELGRRERQER